MHFIKRGGLQCKQSSKGMGRNEGKQMTWLQRSSIINTWSRW